MAFDYFKRAMALINSLFVRGLMGAFFYKKLTKIKGFIS